MKHIKEFNEFISEAARVGRSSWTAILSDLKREGWDVKGKLASKHYDEDEEERKLEIDNDGDDIRWTIYDGRGKELNSGSFDAEGLSAGELDGEVWNYIEESKVLEKISFEDIKSFYVAFKVITEWGMPLVFLATTIAAIGITQVLVLIKKGKQAFIKKYDEIKGNVSPAEVKKAEDKLKDIQKNESVNEDDELK